MRAKIHEILESDTKISLFYDRFMLACIVCSIIPLCFKETISLFIWIDKITVTVFIVDYLLRWMTADMEFQGKKVVAFLRYPFSFFAIVDLLSILPSITTLNSGFKLFKLFRLNKAFKVLKVLRYSKSFNLIISVVKREKKGLIAVGVLAGG